MKVLLCHNFYQQPGGEDQVFADEAWLLESHGHKVVRYTLHNDAIEQMGRVSLAKKTFWNRHSAAEIGALIRRERPAVMHCTNTFPLISPSVYYAARERGVAVVQTLHNYRLLCPKAQLLRNGKPCEACLGKVLAWPGILHGCYRDSRPATAVVAAMSAWHRARGTWTGAVDQFIALTQFARNKFVEGGFPAERITVKPNFVHPHPVPGDGRGGYAVFVGRLSAEKGVETLLDAWSRLTPRVPLKIVGDGPLADRVKTAAAADERIQWLGWQSLDDVCAVIGDAACLLMTSVWYETFGRTMIEAFAKGTPVIASNLGAMAELVAEGETGLRFEPGNPDDLAAKVQDLMGDARRLGAMRRAARQTFEDHYTAAANYDQLLRVYDRAVSRCGLPATARVTRSAVSTASPAQVEP